MMWERPDLIVWFWAVPAWILLAFVAARRRRQRLARWIWLPRLQEILPEYFRSGYVLQFIFLILACIFLLLAWMRPLSGYEETTIRKSSADFYFLVDISQSMLAEDIKPSRLDRARFKVMDLLSRLEGDRAGLIAFAGTAYTFVPLTDDHKTLELFLKDLHPQLIPVQGTDIRLAIDTALNAFLKYSPASEKSIVLISDGEDSTGLESADLDEMRRSGVKLYVLGVGSPSGAPIPRQGGGYVTDKNGSVVISKLDENALRTLAASTGGVYAALTGDGRDLDAILGGGLSDSLKQKGRERTEVKKIPRYAVEPVLIAALIFLVLEILTTNHKYSGWPWRKKSSF